MEKMRSSVLIGIIVISTLFLFIQPIKAESEIIPIYPEEDVSISGMWDEDGIFLSDHNYWNYDLYLGGDLYSGGELRSNCIIFLKFNMPNLPNKTISSIKLRMTQEYNYGSFNWLVKTELVENNWVSENMTWDNQPESIIGKTIYTNLTFISNVMSNHYIELIDFIDDIENGTMSIRIECLTIGEGYSTIQFVGYGRGEVIENPVLIIEYSDEPYPFILTSNSDNPDIDGVFTLYWSNSEYTDTYSVYQNNVLLESELTERYYDIEIYTNGEYNFTIKAFNDLGNMSSNEITVNVEISTTPKEKPYPFVLTSDADNPDMDGIFTLFWTESTRSNTYSVYQNNILIKSGLTERYYDIGINTEGSYAFTIKAFNDFGNISSNEVIIAVEIPPPPPNSFMLTSNADNPDEDGLFMIYWSSSEYTKSYSVYCDDVLLKSGITNLYCNIKVYSSGNYDFKVIAHNDYGETESNEITVKVDIYIIEPDPPEPEPFFDPISEPEMSIIFVIMIFMLVGIGIGSFYFGAIFKKFRGKKT